jgi:hypothetical protein
VVLLSFMPLRMTEFLIFIYPSEHRNSAFRDGSEMERLSNQSPCDLVLVILILGTALTLNGFNPFGWRGARRTSKPELRCSSRWA